MFGFLLVISVFFFFIIFCWNQELFRFSKLKELVLEDLSLLQFLASDRILRFLTLLLALAHIHGSQIDARHIGVHHRDQGLEHGERAREEGENLEQRGAEYYKKIESYLKFPSTS